MFHGVFRFLPGLEKKAPAEFFYGEFLPAEFGNKGRQKTES